MKVRRGHHANALIFNKNNNIVSRFESHGSGTNSYNYNSANSDFIKFFKSKRVIDQIGKWTYKSSSEFCPIGPQSKAGRHYYDKKMGKVFGKNSVIEAGGFCAAWSLLFIIVYLIQKLLIS